MGLADMVPAWRAFSSDIADNVAGNPVLGGKCVKHSSLSGRGTYGYNVSFGKFAVCVGRASYRAQSAVRNRVGHILSSRSPPQVVRFGIGPNTVPMRDIAIDRGWRAMEGFANKPMDLEGLSLAVDPNRHKPIAMPFANMLRPQSAGISPVARRCPAHPTMARNVIIRRAGAFFPKLGIHNQRIAEPHKRGKQMMQFQAALVAGGW